MNVFPCVELPRFPVDRLATVRQAFRHTIPIPLRQFWLKKPEADFAPAQVSIGWRGKSLLLLAELHDRDIFTRAKKPNQRMWELGDVFEMFLCPARQAAYYEFHVTPNNLWLQLRFNDSSVVERLRKGEDFAPCLINKKVFRSSVWLRRKENRWFVYAEIPLKVICEKKSGHRLLLFSFSRYDYTRGRKAPVISSTSPHQRPNFHARHEWAKLKFYKEKKSGTLVPVAV